MTDIFDIIKRFRKQFNKRDIFILLLFVAFFLAIRLINLDKLPIFGDEGIYIHWAKTAWHDASWRFVSLTDGKQPLQTWGTIPFLKLFPNNALLAGRLFSVTTGLIGLVGIFSLLFYLFGKRAAFIGTTLYLFTPFFLFYDRMALVDSGVNAGFIWILFFSILLARTERLDISLLFGFVSGISLLAKSSVRLFLGLSGLAPILFVEKNIRKFFRKFINFIFLYGIGGMLALLIYNIQRLSPFLHFVEEKNKTFVMTFGEFFKTPFLLVGGNLPLIPYYILSEGGVILCIGGIIGLVMLIKRNWRLGLYLLSWLVLPYIAIAFFSRVLYPRYLIFFASVFILTFTYLLNKIKNSILLGSILIITFATVAFFNYMIIFNQIKIPFPDIDRGQYITGATAGWGVKDIVEYARQQSHDKKVLLLAEGDFGVVGDQLEVFVNRNDNIQVKGYWPLDEKNLIENQKELANNHVYVVFAQRQQFPPNWPLKLIKEFKRPENKSSTYLFELTAK